MLYVPIPREKLLLLMPKGGRVAEIGTFRGDFSEAILKTVQPERLHLIDPWRHQDRPDYQSDGSNLSDRGHEDNFAHVRARFADAVADGTVVLHREFSPEAASAFADGSLDWVYIDGMHTLDAVRADLAAWKPKLCEGGLILGHDYIETADYGVIPAVGRIPEDRGVEHDRADRRGRRDLRPGRRIAGRSGGRTAVAHRLQCARSHRDSGIPRTAVPGPQRNLPRRHGAPIPLVLTSSLLEYAGCGYHRIRTCNRSGESR